MIMWTSQPDQTNFRLQIGEAGTNNDAGFHVFTERGCENVIWRSFKEIDWMVERVQCIYIAVDWHPDQVNADLRTIRFRWRSAYHPFMTGKRLDDLFELRIWHGQVECSDHYSPDRDCFGDRLIHLMAECWKRSWEHYLNTKFGPAPRLGTAGFRMTWWPVCIWMHKRPEVAYDLLESGELVQRPQGLGVDEAGLLGEAPPPDGDIPPPSPAERLEVVETGTERITLRWLASRGASGYQIEWSGDGEDFRVLDIMEGDEMAPDKDGWVTFKDQYNVETEDELKQHTHHYRVLACAGDLKDICSTPSNTVKLILPR